MTNRQANQNSRRVLRRFLQLAATSFAIGANVPPASAGNDESPPAAEQSENRTRADGAFMAVRPGVWQHTFSLPALATGPAQRDAHIRVLDATGRNRAQLVVHGDSTVGPFADGAYTVLIKTAGLTEVHRIRIGSDTHPYLQFIGSA